MATKRGDTFKKLLLLVASNRVALLTLFTFFVEITLKQSLDNIYETYEFF